MLGLAAHRAALAVPVLLGVSVMVFAIMHVLPGDPAQIMLAGSGNVTAAQIRELHHELGLDQPIYVQYLDWIGGVLHGDLGRSIQDRGSVAAEILQNAPATFELAAGAMLVALAVGITLGTLAAVRQHTVIDSIASILGVIGTSIPNFWAAIVLILVFSLFLGWLPSTGSGDLPHLVLPALALGLDFAAVNTRLVRSGMVEVLRQDYVRTARAKGMRRFRVVAKHALKNALIPMVTIAGLQFGNLLGGAVVVETVFAREGLGRMLLAGIVAKDYPVVQGVVLFIALAYVLINFCVDVTYGVLDPRIRPR